METHGVSKKPEIAMALKIWLDQSYTGTWGVALGVLNEYGASFSYAANTFLVVHEKNLNWRILIYRSD